MSGCVAVVGLGPGSDALVTPEVTAVLAEATDVVRLYPLCRAGKPAGRTYHASLRQPGLDPGEWAAHPAPSTFGLVAARLGWAIQDCTCLGLHAAPLQRLRPYLAPGRRVIALVRDGAAVGELAGHLKHQGFGASAVHVLEALGGPRERVRSTRADALDFEDIGQLVAVGIAVASGGRALPATPGRADDLFEHDGQITKSPMRALTLGMLAPRPGERLWDIGAGSGSVSIEWLLAHPANSACAVEADPARLDRAIANSTPEFECIDASVTRRLCSCRQILIVLVSLYNGFCRVVSPMSARFPVSSLLWTRRGATAPSASDARLKGGTS